MNKAARGTKNPSNFRKTDVKRAVQAMKSAGLSVSRIELQDGKVVFFPAKDGAEESETDIVL
jgi:hypothetical protein